MKKILFFCLTLSLISTHIASQVYDKNCYYGFTFEMSNNRNWGYGELVITSVNPYSPAEKAGIKIGDIIMEINGKATFLRDNQTIADWLFGDMYTPSVSFTIRNMNSYFKEYPLMRQCLAVNSISEYQLSNIFSFYSLENTRQMVFTLPLNVEPNPNANYTDYHTYDFYVSGKDVPAIDTQITTLLEKELESKGLVRDKTNPDIVVQAYYNYGPNPKFTGLNTSGKSHDTWRYDCEKEQMVNLPIFTSDMKNADKEGQYIVEYGFSLYDRKYLDSTKLIQIWDCNIKDYLSVGYSLAEYVRLHTPLMLKQFPYTTLKSEAKYQVDINKYNYTGMHFDSDDLKTVKDVDPKSPAFLAGIRPGYVIRKINNKKFEHTKESLSEAYKKFISETMAYRDETTKFTNAEGFTDCMFWNKIHYSDIAKAFNNDKYMTLFSYLYNFEGYVSGKEKNVIQIEAWDGMQMRIFSVTPEVREAIMIKAI